jgi:hypothetical protein
LVSAAFSRTFRKRKKQKIAAVVTNGGKKHKIRSSSDECITHYNSCPISGIATHTSGDKGSFVDGWNAFSRKDSSL